MGKSLFIAEKPSVAQEFARALGETMTRCEGYQESDNMVVTWCVGHLVSMSYPDAYDEKYKKWSFDTIPFLPETFRYEVIRSSAKQFSVVKKLLTRPDVDKIWMSRKLVPSPYVTTPDLEVPLQMKGREVFRFAVEACTNGVKRLLDEAGIKKDDVSWFMVHQANKRIIDSIIDFMQVPSERFPVNIQDHGNSSSASCPILLDECNRKGMFKEGDIIVLSAFGAGLLSGAAVLEW